MGAIRREHGQAIRVEEVVVAQKGPDGLAGHSAVGEHGLGRRRNNNRDKEWENTSREKQGWGFGVWI